MLLVHLVVRQKILNGRLLKPLERPGHSFVFLLEVSPANWLQSRFYGLDMATFEYVGDSPGRGPLVFIACLQSVTGVYTAWSDGFGLWRPFDE